MQQQMKIQVPLPIMRDLRCRHCTYFVSLGPVFVVPDGGILCGRCNRIAKLQFRNLAFEALAAHFLYPCYNWARHCDAQLQWNEAVTHESVCKFQSKCKLFWHHPTFLCKAERKISIHDDFQLQHIPDQILFHLKCDLCISYLSCFPIYISDDGKNICHRCIHSNGIPERVLRNLAYEKLASVTIFPCAFKSKGCTMRLPFGRGLWAHESECSYGYTHKEIKDQRNHKYYNASSRDMTGDKNGKGHKDRGVIMTHSGHYFGTITPQSALWAPPRPEKIDPGIEINKELSAMLKINLKNGNEGFREAHQKYVDENENIARSEGYVTPEGPTSPVHNSRRSSLSSEAARRHGGEMTPKTRIHQQFFPRHDPKWSSYNSMDEFPRYSVQNDQQQHQDFARPSLPAKTSYYRSNLSNLHHENHHTDPEDGTPATLGSLDYTPSVNIPRPLVHDHFIQPKRSDSFKIGNPSVIGELMIRQKLASRSHEGDGESVASEDALTSMTSMTNSEGIPECQTASH